MDSLFDLLGALAGAKYAWLILILLVGCAILFVRAVIMGIVCAIVCGLIGAIFGETAMAIGAAIGFLSGVYGEIQKISEEGK